MATETKAIDYSAMIFDLQAKRAAIDAAITNLITASGAVVPTLDSCTGTQFSSQAGPDSQPIELPRGAFLNKSIPAAVKLYLSAMRQKQTIKEIASALREGGVESTSDKFEGVITGCLNRMKANGELLRFKDGWALAEFYPEHLRSRLSQEGPAKRKRTKKSTKKTKKTPKSAKENPSVEQSTMPGQGLEHRIASYVQGDREGIWVTGLEVAQALNADPKAIPLALGRLAKKHGWEKSGDGKYRAGSGNVQEMPKAI